MRLTEPLLRLPIRFDADALTTEVAALPAEAWVPHPNNHPGNAAVRLVTTNGEANDDTLAPMAPTDYLRACPYISAVMAAIGGVWGRSRLMRLAPGAVVPIHVDTHYYWRTHVRLHVPITTTPDVQFSCAGQTVHMAAGECWIFDTFAHHQVRNGGPSNRVHLVLDTVGGEGLWDLIEAARSPDGASTHRFLPGGTGTGTVAFETADVATIMSPWELRYHVDYIGMQAEPDPLLDRTMKRLDRFASGWTATWAQYGPSIAGVPIYRQLLSVLEGDLLTLGGERLKLRNKLPVYRQLAELIFTLNTSLASARH